MLHIFTCDNMCQLYTSCCILLHTLPDRQTDVLLSSPVGDAFAAPHVGLTDRQRQTDRCAAILTC